jgi:hypothetical protein
MQEREINLTIGALTFGLVFSIGAVAESLSKDRYQTEKDVMEKDVIDADHKAAKSACASLSGNRQDICLTRAKGNEDAALAELEARYKPSAKSRHQARIAKADADYAVAREQCDDRGGDARDLCIKQAKAAEAAARAEAAAAMK